MSTNPPPDPTKMTTGQKVGIGVVVFILLGVIGNAIGGEPDPVEQCMNDYGSMAGGDDWFVSPQDYADLQYFCEDTFGH